MIASETKRDLNILIPISCDNATESLSQPALTTKKNQDPKNKSFLFF
jgi:hypothetical protein